MTPKSVWEMVPPATRVLIYLHGLKESHQWATNSAGIEAFTAKGISGALEIGISRLSKILAPLLKQKLVCTERARLQGLKRRPLAYFLTPGGSANIVKELETIFKTNVFGTHENGTVLTMSLGELIQAKGPGCDLVLVLKSISPAVPPEVLTIEGSREIHKIEMKTPAAVKMPESERPGLIDLRASVLLTPHFVGRKKEIAALNDFLASSPARLFTLTGPAAIGKTALISRFVNSAKKTVTVAFHTCREWDTLRNVLEPIAELLNRMGRTRLQYILRNEMQPITLPVASEILKKDMKGISALIVFDDLQKLSFDHRPLLKLFITSIAADDITSGPSGGGSPTWIKVLTTSRDPLVGIFDHRDTIVKELVIVMELRGLSLEETRELLVKENAAGLPVDKVHEITGGHPLHVELITRVGLEGASRDFGKLIDDEIMVKLSADEKAVLGCLSVFKIPVPAEAIRLPQATRKSLERLVGLGLVKVTANNEYHAPDIVIDTTSNSLKLDESRLFHSVAARYHKSLKTEESTAATLRHLLRAEELPEALAVAADNARLLIRLGHGNLMEEAVAAARGRELAGKDIAAESRVRSELALSSGEWKMAQIYLDKGLAAVKGDFKQEGRILVAQAHALREQTMLDESLKKYEEAERASTAVMDIPTMADVFRGQGKVHWKQGDFEKAISYLDKSLVYLKAADQEAEYGETLIDIGLVNNRMGLNEEAINYFHRGIEILEKGKYLHPLARAYNNLGVEYFQKKDYDKAIVCWEKSYEFAKKTNHKRGMVVALENLSDPYSLRGELEKALESLKTAKRLVEDTQDNKALSAIYHCYGKVYSNAKMWKEAFDNYEKSLTILRTVTTPFELGQVLYKYGNALFQSGNQTEAKKKLDESLNLFKECRAEKWMKEVEDLLHKIDSSSTQHPV